MVLTPFLAGGVSVGVDDPLSVWTRRGNIPLNTTWQRTAAGGGLFIAANGRDGRVAFSPDGVVWTNRVLSTGVLASVTYGAGKFLLAASNGLPGVFISTNGMAWVGTNLVFPPLHRTSYANGRYFMMTEGSALFFVSSNGTSWNSASSYSLLNDLAYGNGLYVGVGNFGSLSAASDYVLWRMPLYPTTNTFSAICFHDVFVAVGQSGMIATTLNGTNMTFQSSGVAAWLRDIIYANHQFVAVGDAGVILTSFDGRTWTRRPTGVTNDLRSVASDGQTVVALGASIALQSNPFLTSVPRINPAVQEMIVAQGARTNLYSQVTGTSPMAVFWRRDGADVAGAGGPILAFTNVHTADAGRYSIIASNAYGMATGDVANVSVFIPGPPAITLQPQSRSAGIGSSVTFTVSAVTTNPPLSCQWQFNGADLPGATLTNLTLTNLSVAWAGTYRAIFSDAFTSVPSVAATLTVGMPPTIVQPPLGRSAVVGETVVFSVAAAGPPPLTYRWRRPFAPLFVTNIPNDTVDFHRVANVQTNYGGNYAVTVSNPFGAVTAGFIISIVPDADADGVSDVWEKIYGFDTNNISDAILDADGDGMSNRDEYLAGTNPLDPSSLLALVVCPTNSSLLQFVAQSNRCYALQVRSNLLDAPWERLSNITAQPAVRVISFPAMTNDVNFYRVVTPPP